MSLQDLKEKVQVSKKYDSVVNGLASVYGSIDTLIATIKELKNDGNYVKEASMDEKEKLSLLEVQVSGAHILANVIKNICCPTAEQVVVEPVAEEEI